MATIMSWSVSMISQESHEIEVDIRTLKGKKSENILSKFDKKEFQDNRYLIEENMTQKV
jgi:hypothetical protein